MQKKTLGELCLAAGLWLMASAATAAPQPGQDMPLGPEASAPEGYIAFCGRKPRDCGDDVQTVLVAAQQASLAGSGGAHARAEPTETAALGLAPRPDSLRATASSETLESLPLQIAGAAPIRAEIVTHVHFIEPGATQAEAAEGARPAMTHDLWRTLTRVNRQINDALAPEGDQQLYGRADYWNTPLEDGLRAGDCEDYVLEKERALVAAGVPRSALDIAVVVTPYGQSHAVLLVSTEAGEYVLDSLSPWISPWRETPYVWVKRQVNGNPFDWRAVSPSASVPPPTSGRLLIAWLR
ncbi:transglutaminase-like cysteine peptidase [Phenylobacterium soli]|uniref:Transglutaminase n=1 Tax=Phenylobacterium soli TaxID=2170551 RepID=A0A328AND0_9CAUL|nr:transglutaminase-like cysteine peptidase [Phenylobacterium soli]RAK56079.1 hypothetical protein DJ017_16955 [Phenylobacterium soli]